MGSFTIHCDHGQLGVTTPRGEFKSATKLSFAKKKFANDFSLTVQTADGDSVEIMRFSEDFFTAVCTTWLRAVHPHFDTCPNCGSSRVAWSDPSFENDDTLWFDGSCEDCGSNFGQEWVPSRAQLDEE